MVHGFSEQQRRLIRTLRRLHAAREPLNIVAVKRRHPELLKTVMAVTPYWGWKRALEDAGIAYARIKVELQDVIKCELCGKCFRQLPNHLIGTHEVQSDEYLMDYPESDLMCETLRAKELKTESAKPPHWEPLWSREYALDRLAEYHRRGIPIHMNGLFTQHPNFMAALVRHCGGHRKALKAIGVDRDELRRQTFRSRWRYPDKASVLQALRRRQQDKRPLNLGAISKGKFADHALYRNAKCFFGSWDNVLRAAGFDPIELREQRFQQRRRYPDKPEIIKAIRERDRHGWPSHFSYLVKGEHRDVALLISGSRYFGSWDNALRAAGFDPVKIRAKVRRKLRRYPDKASVIATIHQRQRAEQPLFSAMIRSKDGALVMSAHEYFGSWDNALRAAGIEPVKAHNEAQKRLLQQPCRYPDKPAVIAALQERHRNGRPLNALGLTRGEHRHRDAALLRSACRYFGSWNGALRAAGFDPIHIHAAANRKRWRYPDKPAVIEALQRRRRDGLPVNHGAIIKGLSPNVALHQSAYYHFGSWDNALRAAGFEPDAIRLVKRKGKTDAPDAPVN